MKKIISLVFCMWSVVCGLWSVAAFAADKPLKVVTTTTYFSELVKEIGGERVSVHAIASPKFNVHFIQPRPSDVAKTAQADLFVFGGLDLEAWADPLLEASGRHDLFRGQERNVDLSRGINLKKIPEMLSRSEGDLHAFGNPHYILNPENTRIMAATLSKKLQAVDGSRAEYYQKRTAEFILALDKKIVEWKTLCAHCAGKEVFSYHDDSVYLTHFLGIKEEQYLEPKPGVPPTPKHLAFLENYAEENKVSAVLAASYYPQRTINKLAEKTGVKIVRIAQTPGAIESTAGIFDFYDYNIRAIADALK